MQSRVPTSFIQTQLISLFKSRNAFLLPSALPDHSLFSTHRPGDCDIKGDNAAIDKKVTQPPPITEKPNPVVVEKAAYPKQPPSNPMLGNKSTGPPQGHHKFQKRHIHESSTAELGKGKPKAKRMDEEVVVWMPEQMEHPEETMIRRPKEIWERNRMRGDPNSPQSKLLRALRGEDHL